VLDEEAQARLDGEMRAFADLAGREGALEHAAAILDRLAIEAGPAR
jgi:hypothetical protein